MGEYIERAPLLEALKAKNCEDCPGGYARTKCKTWCDAADNIALVEDAPEVSPYAMYWRKTSENPPTEKDAAYGKVIAIYTDAKFAQDSPWDSVAANPQIFPFWMPMPKPP